VKLSSNRVLVIFFAVVVIGAVASKVSLRLAEAWAQGAADQARIDAETQVRERKLALEKAEAESKLKLTKATVLKTAEEYDAQRTGMGAFKRPGDGYKFTLTDTDSYGKPLLILYSRGAVVDSFKVRSAGPDQTYYTEDDIIEEKWSANGAGAVEGMRNSAGDLLQGARDKIFGGKKDGK
jgi:hypothetical protein